MKHSPVDGKIQTARQACLEEADQRRNSRGANMEFMAPNVINVQQQTCVNGPEAVKLPNHAGAYKLPATSVRHMQRKCKSMTEDNVVVKRENNRENNQQNATGVDTVAKGTLVGVPRTGANSPVPG